MSEETYNGWTNRETWAVALHINNDQGWQESVHEALREAREGWGEVAAHEAGGVIKENVEGTLDDHSAFSQHDLVHLLQDIGSLWRVNWTELGASFLEDIGEE